MYQNPDVVTDFAWRSCVVLVHCPTAPLSSFTRNSSTRRVANLVHLERLHTSVVVGKRLTNLFYNKTYDKSYYLGCSLGGRQGIKASELFPADFDGIVAGSPALDFNNLQSWRANFFPITGPAISSRFISKSSWTTLVCMFSEHFTPDPRCNLGESMFREHTAGNLPSYGPEIRLVT